MSPVSMPPSATKTRHSNILKRLTYNAAIGWPCSRLNLNSMRSATTRALTNLSGKWNQDEFFAAICVSGHADSISFLPLQVVFRRPRVRFSTFFNFVHACTKRDGCATRAPPCPPRHMAQESRLLRNTGTDQDKDPWSRRTFGFAHQAGYEEDVMDARENREERDDRINCWQVDAVKLRENSRKQDKHHGRDLHESTCLAKARRLEAAKAGHHHYGHCDGDDKHIAADDRRCGPERDRKMAARGQQPWDREHHERRYHQEFVGDGVHDGSQFGLLLQTPCDETVDAVGDTRYREHDQCPGLAAVHQEGSEHWDEAHSHE